MQEAKEYGNQHGSTERSNIRKSKKTMSVPEMRRLLGLKKTDSYWLVHRNFFQTYIVNGQMRVDIASFENGMQIRSSIKSEWCGTGSGADEKFLLFS